MVLRKEIKNCCNIDLCRYKTFVCHNKHRKRKLDLGLENASHSSVLVIVHKTNKGHKHSIDHGSSI